MQSKRIMVTAALAMALGGDAAAGEARLSLPAGADAPGTVRLELAPALEGDPEGSIRLQMVVEGPLTGEGARDLFAFNAVLMLPPALTFVGGSVRRGDLLGRDGRNWMVTGAAAPGSGQAVAAGGGQEVTLGGSRMGAVPGVAAPEGSSVLCSFALEAGGPGPFALEWEDAAFIDSHIRRLEAARFMSASLQFQDEAQTATQEDHP